MKDPAAPATRELAAGPRSGATPSSDVGGRPA